jgi:hypothetical protein
VAFINFIREGATTAAVTFNFTVSGTAALATDYVITFPPGITGTWGATSGTVVIPIGSSQVDVEINPQPDSTLENNETVIITLTGTTPALTVSPSNSACVFVIVNDDFVVKAKVLGILVAGTPLVGTVAGTLSVVNSGVAAPNWTNWVQNASATANSIVITPTSGAITYPYLIKYVLRSPSTTPTAAGQVRESLTGNASGQFFLGWISNASLTWDLFYGATSLTPTLTFPNYANDTWIDVIISATAAGTTVVVDGNTTQNTSVITPIWAKLEAKCQSSAFAAVAATVGQLYTPDLFPITSINL